MFDSLTKPALFTLFDRDVTAYALFLTLGVLVGVLMSVNRAKRTRYDVNAALLFPVLAIPLSVILGRLVYCLCNIVLLLDNGFGFIFRIDYGGFSIMGVTIGLALAALLTARLEKVSFLDTLDCVVPGLLMALALARFGEGATINGIGFEINVPGLQFAPIAREVLYGDSVYSVYAVHMGEALVALIAAVYTQTLGKRGRGFVAGVGIVIVACAQIFFESARRDEVLKIDFLRDVMAFAGIVLLCVLIPSLRRSGWKLPHRIIAIVGFVALLGVCALVEFLLDGKIYQNMPFWIGYLTDAVCLTAAAAICCRALKAACEKE